MYTNINILGNGEIFNYIIGYQSTNDVINNLQYNNGIYSESLDSQLDDISFWQSNIGYLRHQNYWVDLKNANISLLTSHIPKNPKSSILTLYFPQYSVDTYESGTKYILTSNIWIHGKSVILSSTIIDRLDSIACDKIMKFSNQLYYEKIDISIPNPFDILYSDDWKDFRVSVCGEPIESDNSQLNNTDSVLYLTLHPVIETSGGYMKKDGYEGGQNGINFIDGNNYLKLFISTNTNENLNNDRPSVLCHLDFNDVYNQDFEEYILETYMKKNCKLRYTLVIGNEEELYATIQTDDLSLDNVSYAFTKDYIIEKTNNFLDWSGWKPGIYIVCSVDILDGNKESILYLLSNKIPLTQNIYRYFVKSSDFIINKNVINSINFDNIDMRVYNINAVNKVVNEVIQIERPETTKSNLIQPVFFRSTEISNIVLHPEVTETICLNLDSYKSQVDTFIIKIEGINFQEIGRNSSGVLFKIIGQKLPKSITNGTYYILNQDSELVTNGKYTYVS